METVTAGRNPTIFNFIDFRKAFDSVHRPANWKILRMYGFPEQILSILQNLYQDSKCTVRTNGDTSEWFNVQTGVRQGCILSSLLFAIVIDWVMRQSTISRYFGLIWVDDTRSTRFCSWCGTDRQWREEVAGVDNSGRAGNQQFGFMCEFQ